MDPDRKRKQQEAYDLQMWGATEVRSWQADVQRTSITPERRQYIVCKYDD